MGLQDRGRDLRGARAKAASLAGDRRETRSVIISRRAGTSHFLYAPCLTVRVDKYKMPEQRQRRDEPEQNVSDP